jgi:hypothetical protein
MTFEEVRRFLGFVGYYRRFVKDFSRIARPLTNLIPVTTKKKGKKFKVENSRIAGYYMSDIANFWHEE